MIRNLFLELFDDALIINAYICYGKRGNILHSNWGDDINYFFIKEIVDLRCIPFSEAPIARLCHRKNYVIIGSVIDKILTSESIVWGAGLITSKPRTFVKPQKICAVRGPKTREVLLSLGIDCPAVYGDPALLLPFYYQPQYKKKYRLGLIPHYSDMDVFVNLYSNNPDVHIIKVRGYKEWRFFIDEISSCEYIASTSLHGLIVAEAYGVPNIWLRKTSGELADTFKFEDFYASIKKYPFNLEYNSNLSIDEIIEACQKWTSGDIKLDSLIESCPFNLKKINVNKFL